MKIAIVGASQEKWNRMEEVQVRHYIRNILDYTDPPILVSGGSPKGGVDIWAEETADIMYLVKLIFKPEVEQWEDKVTDNDGLEFHGKVEDPVEQQLFIRKGFKSRNIQIAEACDILYCFSPGSKTLPQYGVKNARLEEVWNGGIWTANYAEKLGKKVVRIVVKGKFE
ncbi:MAG: hypothetical protein E6L03_10495 [Thaumarchaeota archaeon]|nr:MAG: hypothetical protein E6L03_10495 [Nitrososphaerota archaeon]